MEDTEEVTVVREVSSAWPFSLAFWNILLQVLLAYPVPGLTVSYCIPQDHDFECLLGVLVGEFALVDQGGDVCVEGMDAFVGPLAHI